MLKIASVTNENNHIRLIQQRNLIVEYHKSIVRASWVFQSTILFFVVFLLKYFRKYGYMVNSVGKRGWCIWNVNFKWLLFSFMQWNSIWNSLCSTGQVFLYLKQINIYTIFWKMLILQNLIMENQKHSKSQFMNQSCLYHFTFYGYSCKKRKILKNWRKVFR